MSPMLLQFSSSSSSNRTRIHRHLSYRQEEGQGEVVMSSDQFHQLHRLLPHKLQMLCRLHNQLTPKLPTLSLITDQHSHQIFCDTIFRLLRQQSLKYRLWTILCRHILNTRLSLPLQHCTRSLQRRPPTTIVLFLCQFQLHLLTVVWLRPKVCSNNSPLQVIELITIFNNWESNMVVVLMRLRFTSR